MKKLAGIAASLLFVPSLCYGADSFVSDAIKGDNSEIALGTLAKNSGSSKGVRDFGAMLVTDHSTAKAQMQAASTGSGPTDMVPEAVAEQKKLQALSGAAFDQEFVDYMVDDHQKDIAKFEAEAAKNDGSISALAKKQLPVLRKHLQTAQSLQSTLDKH